MWQYGLCLLNHLGVQRNPREALKYFEMAASKGYAEAEVEIGIMYLDGIGVVQDKAKAFEHFQSAADKRSERGRKCLADVQKKLYSAPEPKHPPPQSPLPKPPPPKPHPNRSDRNPLRKRSK
jgi:TPR repeat protein